MLCPKCGNELSDESIFCDKCGYKISKEQSKIKKILKNYNKVHLKYTLIAGFACVIIIIIFILMQTSPLARFKRAASSNNYAKASKIYDKSIRGNKNRETELANLLKSDINDLKKKFTENKIDYNAAISKLDKIDRISLVSLEITSAKNGINNLNDSRTAFKQANEFLKNKNYKDALPELKKVIKEDENYDKALELINNSVKDYKNVIINECDEDAKKEDYDSAISLLSNTLSVLPNDSDLSSKKAAYEKINEEKKAAELKKQIDDAKANQELIVEKTGIHVQSPEYKALYPDMIQVIVRNNTNKTLKNMIVSCLGFDENGYPLKIRAPFDSNGGSFEFIGNAQNINIIPKAAFGNNSGWDLDERHGIKTILACVKEAEYYDGSKWSNPYYYYWLQEYKEKPLH